MVTTNHENNHLTNVLNENGDVIKGIVEIFAGSAYSLFLKNDGTVSTVGYNGYGQLGNGTTTNHSLPVKVLHANGTALSGVVSISGGLYHSVYLRNDGTVWATGRNNYGQLGDGTVLDRINPVQVLAANGSPLTGIVEISAGDYHTLYRMNDGTVWATGYNFFGFLGDGTQMDRSLPVQVIHSDGTILNDVVQVSATTHRSCFLQSNGTAWGVGIGHNGELGDDWQVGNLTKIKNSEGLDFTGLVEICATSNHTTYLRSDGTVWSSEVTPWDN